MNKHMGLQQVWKKTSMRTFHNNGADCPALPLLNVITSHHSNVKFPKEFWEG